MEYELKFDPKTIDHLGVKMYSTLPPALAELISNAYDADASEVIVTLAEVGGYPKSITVKDNGQGMSSKDIQEKFLVIGRDRRKVDGDKPSPKYKRLPTGKKGLGKLALFSLAKEVTIDSRKANLRNQFTLDWEVLLASDSVYRPKSPIQDAVTKHSSGTSITLKKLKRKTPFDLESIADSLSKIFIIDKDFKITLKKYGSPDVTVNNNRKYGQIKQQFKWTKKNLDLDHFDELDSIQFELITSEKPIKPSSGLRGITLFSRGKLVNAPEFFLRALRAIFTNI